MFTSAAGRAELSKSAERAGDAVEDAVHEAGRAGIAEPMRQVYRLVDRDFRRNFTSAKLVNAEAENVPLDHGHAIHAPVLRGSRRLGIQDLDFGDDASRQLLSPIQDPRLG